MRTTRWDRLATAVPCNRTAARVVIQSRTSDVSAAPSRYPRELPKVIPVPAGMTDYTGKVVGKFTVIGFRAKKNPARRSVWFLQCTCGKIEGRQHRSVKNPHRKLDFCCWDCLEVG